MNYRLSSDAQADLDDCWLYIAQDNVQSADRFVVTIKERLDMLVTHPHLGRRCDELAPHLQRLPVGSYAIFYRHRPSHLEIVRILHGARDIDSVFNPPEEP